MKGSNIGIAQNLPACFRNQIGVLFQCMNDASGKFL